MHRLVTVLGILLALVAGLPAAAPADPDVRIGRIENGLRPFTSPAAMLQPDAAEPAGTATLAERMRHYQVPGVGLAVVAGGGVAWARSYGVMDAGTAAPVTAATRFEAASTSKFVTAVLALHLVQTGRLELDRDVNDYLKSWRVPDTDHTRVEKVTLRRLLTHQAGLPATNFGTDPDDAVPTLAQVLGGVRPAVNKPAVPELVPGTRWQYSNIGYVVIQQVLEDVTGRPFPELADEIVFRPLGMSASSFRYPLDPAAQRQEAMPHDATGAVRRPIMCPTAFAHGGLTTTPTDLAVFAGEIIRAYQGRSDRILSRESARRLLHPELNLDPRMFGLPLAEGLGVMLMGEGADRAFAHPGSNLPGLNCWLVGWPERGTAVVVMTNGAQGEVLAMEIIAAFHREYNREH